MRYFTLVYFVFPIISLLLLFVSCPVEIISKIDIIRIEDDVPPVLTVFAPENNGYYSSQVLVRGQTADFADNKNTPGRVDSLHYSVIGTGSADTIDFDETGYFSFTFFSDDFEGEKTLVITARDWNRNTTEVHITLNKGSFQSLTCTPGNKKIILDWDIPPEGEDTLIQSYTLYYTHNGAIPDPSNSEIVYDILPPYPLENLTNGLLYSIVIQGNTGGDVDDWSGLVRTIPLSPFTLAPKVKGEYHEITLSWKNIPGAEGYRILRSTEKNGYYTEIPGIFTSPSWVDRNILPDRPYYYKIKPAMEESIESEAMCGESFVFPPFASYIGSCDTGDFAYNIAVSGSYVYVADRNNGLCVIDITNPSSPVRIGQCSLPGYAYDIVVQGEYAFVAADAAGLCVIHIADPADPSLKVVRPVGGNTCAIAASESFVYVTVNNFGLKIIDVTDPLSPEQEGFCEFSETAKGITLGGNYAYIAAGEPGLIVLDVTTASSPGIAGSYDTPHNAYDVVVAGSLAYVADDVSGLQILDVSDVSAIKLKGSYDVPNDAPDAGGARGVSVSGMYAYIANDTGGVLVVNVKNPALPECVASYKSLSCAKGIVVRDEYAFVAANDQGLYILSSAEPQELSLEYPINTSSDVIGIAIDGTYAYLAVSGVGIQVYDVSPGITPVSSGSYTAKDARNITLCGNFGFITGNSMGVEIIDITDPSRIEYVGVCSVPDSIYDAQLWGDILYVSYYDDDNIGGVKLYDISDPWNPEFVSGNKTVRYARGLALSGEYVYVTNGNDGICVMDMEGKIAGVSYKTNGTATGITLSGTKIYIANGRAGIQAADISNPVSPSFIGSYNTKNGFSYKNELCGRYLFVADELNGLVVLDSHEPESMIPAGAYPIEGGVTTDVVVRGKYAYINAGSSMHIINLWTYDDLYTGNQMVFRYFRL